MCLWLCSSPGNGSPRHQLPYLCISIPGSGLSRSVRLWLRKKCFCPSSPQSCQGCALLTQNLHYHNIYWGCCELLEGEGQWLCICGLVFCLVIAVARPQRPFLCAPSLPIVGLSQCVLSTQAGMLTLSLCSLVLQSVLCNPTLSLLPSLLGPGVVVSSWLCLWH